MPRKDFRKVHYKTDSGKRKRKKAVAAKKSDRHAFRETMIRSLDELEDGGYLPSYLEVKELLDCALNTIEYCIKKNIVQPPPSCPRCNGQLKTSEAFTVRCRNVNCAYTAPVICQRCTAPLQAKKIGDEIVECNCPKCEWQWRPGLEFEASIFRGSLFQNCKVPKNKVFHCMWLWIHKVKSSVAAHMLCWQEDTVGRWYRYFRQIVSQMINNHIVGEGVQSGGIGEQGNPIVVEIDESKFGKRKCNKGRRVRANWVIGMVERTEQRRCVMVVVEKRNQDVCVALVRKHIKEGSIIFSDEWKGYNPINKQCDKAYNHKTLCHKREFVKVHEDGTVAHTQTIEGNWGGCKRDIPVHKRNGADLQDCLDEFMWRRANAGELWKALLKALSTVRCAAPELLRVNSVADPWEPTDVLVNPDDCVDYDSEATSDTESDEDVTMETTGRASVENRNTRRPRTETAVPDAIPSVQHRELERAAALELELQQRIADDLTRQDIRATQDGARGKI